MATRTKALRQLKTFYLNDVAQALQVSPTYLRCLINRHPTYFGPPVYRRKGSNPRLHRVLTIDEIAFLQSKLLVKKILRYTT